MRRPAALTRGLDGLRVLGDAKQQRQEDVVGDERGPAVGDKRQRDPGQWDKPGNPADDDEALDPDDQGQAGGEELLELAVAAHGDPQTGADHQQVGHEQGDAPTRPSSSAMTAKIRSVDASGRWLALLWPGPSPNSPPAAMANDPWMIW